MAGFDERKKSFETKMVLDAEQEFKLQARRNKLLGMWVAKKLGKSDEEAGKYAMAVIKADMEEDGDDDVFRFIKQDLIAGGHNLSDTDIREKMDVFLTEARAQLFE
ncbi:MAG: DUF1476 domain-containing protein [Acidimicrobiales bacterium]|nr:DUF1476 domain-containing protein [Hyphomonadaceae bacterium]RZV43704.1 MAG: DUF1476 domain-containing protein [Acidimicrobiales bacterium]